MIDNFWLNCILLMGFGLAWWGIGYYMGKSDE